MPKIISCGIVPIRKNNEDIEILLCKPTNSGLYGMGFLKGQIEENESLLDAAKREFCEESGGLEVSIINETLYFIQNNPKKKIYIWPATVQQSKVNDIKINSFGEVPEHDHENELIKFYPINNLPIMFKNQQQILDELLSFIKNELDLRII